MTVTTTYSIKFVENREILSEGGSAGGLSTDADAVVLAGGVVATAIDDADETFNGREHILVRFGDVTDRQDAVDPSLARLKDGTLAVVGTSPAGQIKLWLYSGPDAPEQETLTANGRNAEIAGRSDNGGFAVVNEAPGEGGLSGITLSTLDASGDFNQVSVTYGFRDRNPSVAYLRSGEVVIAWDRTDASGNTEIMYAIYSQSGQQVAAPIVLDTAGSVNVKPSVAAYDDGFTIAYEDNASGESQIKIFNNPAIATALTFTEVGSAGAPNSDASATGMEGLYAVSYTQSVLREGEVVGSDVRLVLTDPETGEVLGGPNRSFLIASEASDSSITADPGRTGRIVVSYYSEFDGYVRQQIANVVATITGDAEGQGLSGRSGVAVWIDGKGGDDFISDSDGDDRLLGDTGDDVIRAGRGDDFIDGGDGIDTLDIGGYGPIVIDLTKTGAQNTGVGIKTIRGIENLKGLSSSVETLVGNDKANILDCGGSSGGNDGVDTLIGNGGDDTYIVNRSETIVRESSATGGVDTVIASNAFALSNNVENLTLVLDAGAASATGNSIANVITGNVFLNMIDGKGGADTMRGLGGDDTYRVDSAGDRVFETANEGFDTVITSVSHTLVAGQWVELLTSDPNGTAAITLIGNELAQTLEGNRGANTLDGRGGPDTMDGDDGDDSYIVDNAGDRVFEYNNSGYDRVLARVNFALEAAQHVEFLSTIDNAGTAGIRLTGNEFAQRLLGNAGVNVLDGRGGADAMQGLGGNDLYYVDNVGDQILEAANGGTDKVYASVSYKVAAGQSVEWMQTTSNAGATPIALFGNELAQQIFGNAGTNKLDGGGGLDTLTGLGGTDIFVFSTTPTAANYDRITDFSHVDDTIQLSRSVFAALPVGALAASAFKDIGGGAAIDANDRIIYNSTSGALYYDSNGSGAGGSVLFAILNNHPANLDYTDFRIA